VKLGRYTSDPDCSLTGKVEQLFFSLSVPESKNGPLNVKSREVKMKVCNVEEWALEYENY